MGYNICLVKLEGDIEHKQEWFDEYANGGFRELITKNEWEILYIEDYYYYRPKDFDKVKEWIANNWCNKHYLNPAIEQMQKDKDLWFTVSC